MGRADVWENFTYNSEEKKKKGNDFQIVLIHEQMENGSFFFKGLCNPKTRNRLTLPLLRQVESRHSPKVILVGTKVCLCCFLNNTNALKEFKCVSNDK